MQLSPGLAFPDMVDVRRHTAGWVVSPAMGIVIAAAMVGAVFVVRKGESEQQSRRIPTPRSAAVTVIHADHTVGQPTALAQAAAVRLATLVDRSPHQPGHEQHCGAEVGSLDRVVFTTNTGPVVVSVDLGGCLGVEVASNGSDWGVQRWDPDAVLSSAIAADIRSIRES